MTAWSIGQTSYVKRRVVGRPDSARHGIVGGEIIVEGGRSTRVDQDAVVSEALARAGELAERIKPR